MMTMRSLPGCSSSALNPRPLLTDTPRKEKKFADTRAPPTRSGSASPVRLHSQGPRAAISEKSERAVAPCEIGLDRRRKTRELLAALRNDDLGAVDPLGVFVRQRLQQHGVENAENRCRRADSQG